MVKLSKEAKQRLQQLFKGGQFAIRWGFIPLVIYLGFKRGADPGMPEPTVLRPLLSQRKGFSSHKFPRYVPSICPFLNFIFK
uniref:Mitochondrial import receptor subunit TOM7 homolog n=1 Tax=Ursus americanus TaxID=9643 RepID=A0A452QVL3_URSAM